LNLNNKQQTIVVPELIVNQPTDIEKQKYYNTNGTQTIVLEEKDESIDDDMEIVPIHVLNDDFVQLDLNECNEQEQPKVS
jgi:hypothetical protein